MIRRNTWILLILLAALVGFAFYLKNQKAKTIAQATPTLGIVYLFNSSEGTPNDIKIVDSTGNSVEVSRNSSGTWELKAPTEAAADQGSVEAAATQVSALRILNDVQLGPDVVGLDKPSYVFTVAFSSNQTHKLTVGSVTPIQDGYYVQLDGSKIQIVEKQGLDALLGLLMTPPYAATLTPAVSATPTRQPDTPTPEITLTPPAASATETSTKSP
jgi:hypothetical protein